MIMLPAAYARAVRSAVIHQHQLRPTANLVLHIDAVTFGKTMDEKEMICWTCFILGFTIPMLQFAMSTGPISFIAWVGTSALDESGDSMWSNFRSSDWHVLYLCIRIVEALFMWLDTLMCLLLAIGFGMFSIFAPARLPKIVNSQMRLAGLVVTGCLFMAFFCGVMREASWFFEIGVVFFYGISSMVGK